MAKSFILVLAAIGVVAFSISPLAFRNNEIGLDLPEISQSDNLNKQSLLNEIEHCIENNLAGGTVSLNSFNTNMLMTLKEVRWTQKVRKTYCRLKKCLANFLAVGHNHVRSYLARSSSLSSLVSFFHSL